MFMFMEVNEYVFWWLEMPLFECLLPIETGAVITLQFTKQAKYTGRSVSPRNPPYLHFPGAGIISTHRCINSFYVLFLTY